MGGGGGKSSRAPAAAAEQELARAPGRGGGAPAASLSAGPSLSGPLGGLNGSGCRHHRLLLPPSVRRVAACPRDCGACGAVAPPRLRVGWPEGEAGQMDERALDLVAAALTAAH